MNRGAVYLAALGVGSLLLGALWPEQPARLIVVDVDQATGHAVCVPDGSLRGERIERVSAGPAALDRADRELRDYHANRRQEPPDCPVLGT